MYIDTEDILAIESRFRQLQRQIDRLEATVRTLRRLRPLLEGEAGDLRDTYLLQDRSAAEAWNDPADAVYDRYRTAQP